MEPRSPSPYPLVPATCPYPEPTPSSPHNPSNFLKIHLNIILPYIYLHGTKLRTNVTHDFVSLDEAILFNPLAYTDIPETVGLARSINTQLAVKHNSETNPTSQHNRGIIEVNKN